jgi:hypothetical protein
MECQVADDISSSTLPMRVLDQVFAQTGDNLAVPAAVWEIRLQLGTDADRVAAAVRTLARTQLVEQAAALGGGDGPSQVFITREGAKLAGARTAARSGSVARALTVAGPGTASTTSAEALAPAVVAPPWRRTAVPPSLASAGGALVATSFETASPLARESTTGGDRLGDTAARQVREFLNGYEQYKQQLRDEVGQGRADEISDDVDTLKVQIDARSPKTHVIRALIDSIRSALERTDGGVVIYGLLHYVGEIKI